MPSSINKIGKIGKRNIKANKELKKMFKQKEITTCELNLEGCVYNHFLSFAHRHKRIEYRSHPELLSDFNQVILACTPCHQIIENNKSLSDDMFELLRGEDKHPTADKPERPAIVIY